MNRIEVVHRRMRNTYGEDVAVGAITVFELSAKSDDDRHRSEGMGISDITFRRRSNATNLLGPKLFGNMTVDELIDNIMDIWNKFCGTDADIVIKFEEGLGKFAPRNPLSTKHSGMKPWAEFKQVEIPRENIVGLQNDLPRLFNELIQIARRSNVGAKRVDIPDDNRNEEEIQEDIPREVLDAIKR